VAVVGAVGAGLASLVVIVVQHSRYEYTREYVPCALRRQDRDDAERLPEVARGEID